MALPLQVVGGTLVVAVLEGNQINGSRFGLQFRDVANGRLRRTQELPVGTVDGMAVDSFAGRPVAVVWHTSTADPGGRPVQTTTAYDADGTMVWDSANQAGLAADRNGYPAFSGGFIMRTSQDQSTDLLDTRGGVVLHVPLYDASDRFDPNRVALVAGHALVARSNRVKLLTGTGPSTVSFALHDLARGTVVSFTEPGSEALDGRDQRSAMAGSQGRVLVSWLSDRDATMIAAVDTATGLPSAPAQVPLTDVAVAVDDSTGNALLYSPSRPPTAHSVLVSPGQGRLLWTQSGTAPLLPLSMHGGTIYGVTYQETSAFATFSLTPVAVTEATGAVAAHSFEAAPVAFSASGNAIVVHQPTTSSPVTIGSFAPVHA
jgi:hypothetical protein